MGAELIVPSTGGSAPSGTGFVRTTGGAFVDPAQPLGATEIQAALDAGSGTADQLLRGNGDLTALSAADIPIFSVATTTRSTNAFSGDLPTTPTLATGLVIRWKVPSAPSGAATYNLNSLGAKNIFVKGAANVAADLPAGRYVTMLYDGTQWQVIAFGTLVPGDLPMGIFPLSSVSGTNTITATASVTPVAGMLFAIVAANTISGAATLNINSGGAVAIKKQDGTTALASGDLIASKAQLLYFDGTVYRLVTGIPLASTDVATAGGKLLQTWSTWSNYLDLSNGLLGSNAVGNSLSFSSADVPVNTVGWVVNTYADQAGVASAAYLEAQFDGTNWVRAGAAQTQAAEGVLGLANSINGLPPCPIRARNQNGAAAQTAASVVVGLILDPNGRTTPSVISVTSTAINNGVTFQSAEIDLESLGAATFTFWILASHTGKYWIEAKYGSTWRIMMAKAFYNVANVVSSTSGLSSSVHNRPKIRINFLNDSGSNQTQLIIKCCPRTHDA